MTKVPKGGVVLVAPPVDLPTLQVSEHRARLERDCAGERISRGRRIVPRERRFALLDEQPVVPFAPGFDEPVDPRQDDAEQDHRGKCAFHSAMLIERGTSGRQRVLNSQDGEPVNGRGGKMAEGLSVKPVPSITWADVDGREAALIQRCAARDEDACAELVTEHQRMVYQLSLNLLGDHNEALDLSQEVFLRVFRTIQGFRGQSALRTWIYRIVVNQARNRQRWWRRRHRAQLVSLDEHVRDHGDLPDPGTGRRRIGCSARSSSPNGFASRWIGCLSIRKRPSCCARLTA